MEADSLCSERQPRIVVDEQARSAVPSTRFGALRARLVGPSVGHAARNLNAGKPVS